jgi:hypothetical protein
MVALSVGIIGAAALFALPVLLLYGLLWWSALDIPHRLSPALDWYASFWSLGAINLATYHAFLAFRRSESASLLRLFWMSAASVLVISTCPEFMY